MTDSIDIQTQLDIKWLVFWWALVMSMATLGIAWMKGFFKSFKPSVFPHITGEDVLRGFGLFIAVEALVIPILAGVAFSLLKWDPETSNLAKGWINFLMVLGGFATALFVYYFLTPEQRGQLWKQGTESSLHNLGVGIAAWFICFPLVMAFNQIISITVWHLFHHPFVEQSVLISLRLAKESPFLFGATALSLFTLVPFTEEFLFRGLLQSWLKRKFGMAWAAILLTSLVFACFHFTLEQGFTNIELLSTLFLLSCFLGYVFERQRSLWASIGLHGFFNLMSVLMVFFSE